MTYKRLPLHDGKGSISLEFASPKLRWWLWLLTPVFAWPKRTTHSWLAGHNTYTLTEIPDNLPQHAIIRKTVLPHFKCRFAGFGNADVWLAFLPNTEYRHCWTPPFSWRFLISPLKHRWLQKVTNAVDVKVSYRFGWKSDFQCKSACFDCLSRVGVKLIWFELVSNLAAEEWNWWFELHLVVSQSWLTLRW